MTQPESPLTAEEEARLRRWADSASPSARAKTSRLIKRLLVTLDMARAALPSDGESVDERVELIRLIEKYPAFAIGTTIGYCTHHRGDGDHCGRSSHDAI